MKLSGWGRYPKIEAKIFAPRNEADLLKLIQNGNAIARGNGRSYGDSAVSRSNTIHMKNFNRMLSFSTDTGQLVAESGVLLADVIEVFLKRGWFPAVTPGTKFVTLGGMIATDVHGKNHHKDGSFGKYVDWIELLTADGSVKRCSKNKNTELFNWTIGGMGLTGVILRASIRLRKIPTAWIKQHTVVSDNIQHTIKIFEKSHQATYSVAWIDCLQSGSALGRSLVMLGEHAEVGDVPIQYQKIPMFTPPKHKWNLPIEFPRWILNRFSARAFNSFYYWNGKLKPAFKVVDWDNYFYPLDAVIGWNKIYGRCGFVQFQCVIPLSNAEQGLTELLEAITYARVGSFLAVLKRFGEQSSKFSFPMEGYTLALDFAVNKKTLNLMHKLDQLTIKHNGRFYLAKDSRISHKTLRQSEHRAEAFKKYRELDGSADVFVSAQSERLKL